MPEQIQAIETVVCLGYFDGVHLGHQALLRAGREKADELGLQLWVHTFDRAPENKGMALTSLEERIRLLKVYGADQVFVSPFDDQMRRMPGEDFFVSIVIGKMHARHIICGNDHRFGYLGKCDIQTLKLLCKNTRVGLTVVPAVEWAGRRVSSTAIRQALAEGNISLAEGMLGRRISAE